MYLIMVIEDNLPQDVILVTADLHMAQSQFLDTCSERLSNWDEYTAGDRDGLLDDGYCEYAGKSKSVVMVDTDGPTSDDAIRDELTKQPAADMTVAEIIQDGEIALTKGMTVDEILEMCCDNLDSACSWEIQGQILFKGSDGKWYTITTESIIAEANPDFVKDVLAENKNA